MYIHTVTLTSANKFVMEVLFRIFCSKKKKSFTFDFRMNEQKGFYMRASDDTSPCQRNR